MLHRYLKIPIHLKPWVKKYIIAKYGHTILVSMKNPVSILIYSLLQKKNIPFRQTTRDTDKRFGELSESMNLLLHNRDRYNHGLHIHKSSHMLINNYFEEEIMENIFLHCEVYRKSGFAITMAVEDFCTSYDIELDVDITMEAALKAEYRYRQAKKKLSNRSAILSTC